MSSWYSIEVLDGASSAALWTEAYADVLVEAALSHGADDWSWHRHSWGTVFEISFAEDTWWDAYCSSAVIRAALDAVPDPLTGLILYRGRGGSAGTVVPRRPRPLVGSGAAALPLPSDLGLEDISTVWSLLGPAIPHLATVGSQLR